jgi:hypothetical protein
MLSLPFAGSKVMESMAQFMPNAAALAYASDCAAYLIGKEALGERPYTGADRREVAAHEAGHVVVMSALGFQPEQAKLYRHGGAWRGFVLRR